MKKTIIGTLTVTSALVLSACSTGYTVDSAPADDTDSSAIMQDATEAPDEKAADGAPPADAPAATAFDSDAHYGDTVTFDDGLKLTVDHEEDTQMDEYWSTDGCSTGDTVQIFRFTIENGSDAPYSPYEYAEVSGTYTDSEGYTSPADSVFGDYGNETLDALMSMPAVRPGQKATALIGFCAADSVDVVELYVDLSAYDYESTTYREPVTYTKG